MADFSVPPLPLTSAEACAIIGHIAGAPTCPECGARLHPTPAHESFDELEQPVSNLGGMRPKAASWDQKA